MNEDLEYKNLEIIADEYQEVEDKVSDNPYETLKEILEVPVINKYPLFDYVGSTLAGAVTCGLLADLLIALPFDILRKKGYFGSNLDTITSEHFFYIGAVIGFTYTLGEMLFGEKYKGEVTIYDGKK